MILKIFFYIKEFLVKKNMGTKQKIQLYKMNKAREMKMEYERKLKILHERLNKRDEKIQEMEKKLPEMEQNKKEKSSKLKILEKEKKDLKDIKDNISEKLYFHYLSTLKEGIDTRNQGFSTILQEIVNLDKRILLSYFTDYLDFDSIKYLL